MKIRTTNIKERANEVKVRAWKQLCLLAFQENNVQALEAIIGIGETFEQLEMGDGL